jgi:uncharacterized protein YeaO (DUF488 family)
MSGRVGDINIKRIYDPPAGTDGARVLVDRVWPRGMTKERAAVDLWLKEIAPTAALRKWFGHDAQRWPEFRSRYRAELDRNTVAVDRLFELMKGGKLTLLFGAQDVAHNNAVALAEYLTR